MTGEMSRDEVTEENFPIHFAIANALGGTVHPFDQYQGPYISDLPNGGKLWLIDNGFGPGLRIWNERNDRTSGVFYFSETALQIEYARGVLEDKQKTTEELDSEAALEFCRIRNIKITERSDENWVLLDMEHTPFWWATFTCETDAAKAYRQYRSDLDDARAEGEQQA